MFKVRARLNVEPGTLNLDPSLCCFQTHLLIDIVSWLLF